ncbi:MAG TPA: hypothetical protein VLZ07_00445 [Syntrophales bacterium]|nr:hypothetical protein [Syntrophales bacterium]
MYKKAYYRKLFVVGAFWNWGAGVLFFFWSAEAFALLKMQPLNYAAVMQLAMALVFAFGIGYYWVSRDLSKNHDIVKIGIIAKILVFFVLSYHYLVGNIPLLLALCGVVDLTFALLFIEFLRRTARIKVLA